MKSMIIHKCFRFYFTNLSTPPQISKDPKNLFLKSVIIKFLKLLNPQHRLLKGR